MSTLKVTNIQATGETASRAVSGVAAVWGSFDQDTAGHPTYDSQNVSSTTDNSTGETTVGFTNNMSNADYALSGTVQSENENAAAFSVIGKDTTFPNTVSSFRTDNRNAAGNNQDCKYVSFSIHGDLA
jgi:hypothetical protein